MTTSTLEPLRDGIDDALQTWAQPAREHLPLAVWCAEAHPVDETELCRRLSGHSGCHASDGADAWASEGDS